jgi:hypothetical protein
MALAELHAKEQCYSEEALRDLMKKMAQGTYDNLCTVFAKHFGVMYTLQN